MKLGDLIRSDLVKCGLLARTKEELLAELSKLVADVIKTISEQEVIELLEARERQGPFSMKGGVAYPHIRTEKIQDFIIAIGTCPHGIDFKAPDSVPIKLVIMFLVPKAHSNIYLHTLASFLNFFSLSENVERVSSSKTKEGIVETLGSYELHEKHKITLVDLLDANFIFVTPQTKLEDCARTMLSRNVMILPVCDNAGALLGALRLESLLGLLNRYGARKDALLEDAPALISPRYTAVQRTCSIDQLIKLALNSSGQDVYVLDKDKLVGVIHTPDLLRLYLT